jgi:hypothetical protein
MPHLKLYDIGLYTVKLIAILIAAYIIIFIDIFLNIYLKSLGNIYAQVKTPQYYFTVLYLSGSGIFYAIWLMPFFKLKPLKSFGLSSFYLIPVLYFLILKLQQNWLPQQTSLEHTSTMVNIAIIICTYVVLFKISHDK